MVLSTPAFESLRHRFPNSELEVLASQVNAPLLRNHPVVDHVIVWGGAPRSLWSFKSLRAMIELKRRSYDLALDMVIDWPMSATLLAAYLAPCRTGFRLAGKGAFHTLPGARPDRHRHFIDNNDMLLEAIGVPSSGNLPSLGLTAKELPFPFASIGIHPGGHFEGQRWPSDRWIELLLRIKATDTIGEIVVLAEAGKEGELEIQSSERLPGCRIVHTQDVYRLALAIGGIDVLLCNNSGPLHIAGALGIPTLSTLGPTNRDMWWPKGDIHVVVESATSSVEDIPVDSMLEGWKALKKKCGSSI